MFSGKDTEKTLKKEVEKRDRRLRALLGDITMQSNKEERLIDTLVKQALQKARRNVTSLVKVAPGVFVSRSKQILTLSLSEDQNGCYANFVSQKKAQGEMTTIPLEEFIQNEL